MAEVTDDRMQTAETAPTPEGYLRMISGNVETLLKKTPLSSDLTGLPSGGGAIRAAEHPAVVRMGVMTEVRKLVEDSHVPARITEANMRNKAEAERGRPPIRQGSFIHGMPLNHAENIPFGLLSGDLYRGKVTYEDPLALYVSEIGVGSDILSGMSPADIIGGTMSKWFMGKGSIALVLTDRPDFRHRLPDIPFKPDEINKYGMPKPVSIGVSAPNLAAAVTYTPEDAVTAAGILTRLPFYVPLYGGNGELQLPFASWLSAQKPA